MPAAIIQANQNLSDVVDLGDQSQAVNLQMPAAWTAAVITFQASVTSDGPFQNVYNDGGTELSITVAASRFVVIDWTKLKGIRYLKIRSGTNAATVPQAQQRTIIVVPVSRD